MQLPRADAIRSRLIDTFSLIEHLQGLSQAVPRHTIREILELLESSNTKLWPLKLTLEVAAWFILLVFILEILLMWLSSFFLFWKNAWNVFDFVVTILSLLPEVVVLVGATGQSVWLQLLRICRVLRDASQQEESLVLSEASQEKSKYAATEEGSKTKESLSKMKKSSSSSSSSSSSTSSSCSASSDSRDFDSLGHLDWETHVHQNLPGLMDMDQDERVVWPRDSLFRYFELLEKLQYNLEERKRLQEFAVQALMNFEDK